MDRENLITELAGDLKPVRAPAPLPVTLVLWLALTWAVVVVLTLLSGPMRPDAGHQVLASPRFAFETLLGFAAILGAYWGALELSLPNPRLPIRHALPFLLLFGGWAGLLVIGLWFPALEPSMLGKRPGCASQTLLFSLVPMAAGFAVLRSRAAIHRAWAGALVGAASAAVPALLMQFACMYLPSHDLTFHLGPVGVAAAIGALAGVLFLRRV